MTTTHASAVLIGAKAVLIRGPSGAGKSSLAWRLIEAGRQGLVPFARLVGDDRVEHAAMYGRLLVRPAQTLAGLLEIRGLGIRKLAFEPVAQVELVVDLGQPGAERLPEAEAATVTVEGIRLPRLAVASADAAVPVILAFLRTETAGD
jgi:serine kinase of HPr protein (carbohydrate metabolism regulator)